MAEHGELGQRKAAVLHTIVEEYVRTGEPVGSETIAERAGLGGSSATIRNEVAALEELGFLSHPDTSAGRSGSSARYRERPIPALRRSSWSWRRRSRPMSTTCC